MSAPRRWLSVNETAAVLGVHSVSVRRMIARGDIPAAHVGRLVRVDGRLLEARLESEIKAAASSRAI